MSPDGSDLRDEPSPDSPLAPALVRLRRLTADSPLAQAHHLMVQALALVAGAPLLVSLVPQLRRTAPRWMGGENY